MKHLSPFKRASTKVHEPTHHRFCSKMLFSNIPSKSLTKEVNTPNPRQAPTTPKTVIRDFLCIFKPFLFRNGLWSFHYEKQFLIMILVQEWLLNVPFCVIRSSHDPLFFQKQNKGGFHSLSQKLHRSSF